MYSNRLRNQEAGSAVHRDWSGRRAENCGLPDGRGQGCFSGRAGRGGSRGDAPGCRRRRRVNRSGLRTAAARGYCRRCAERREPAASGDGNKQELARGVRIRRRGESVEAGGARRAHRAIALPPLFEYAARVQRDPGELGPAFRRYRVSLQQYVSFVCVAVFGAGAGRAHRPDSHEEL